MSELCFWFNLVLYSMKIYGAILVFWYNFGAVVCLNFFTGRQGTKQATFERLDNSCGHRNLSLVFNLLGMRSEGTKLWMNSTMTVKYDIMEEPRMFLRVERCKNRENLDTCEHFFDHKVENYCSVIADQSALWTPLFSKYVPKFKCPVMKGLYQAIDSELDASALLLFPSDAWFWRTKVEVKDKKTDDWVSCIYVEAHISNK